MYVVYFNSSSISNPRVLYKTESLSDMIQCLSRKHWIESWFTVWKLEGSLRTQICRIYSNRGNLKWFFPIQTTPVQNTMLVNINERRSLEDRAFRWRLTIGNRWVA